MVGLSKSKVLPTLCHIWPITNAFGKCVIAKQWLSDTSSECYSLPVFAAQGPPKPKYLLDISCVLCHLTRCIFYKCTHSPCSPYADFVPTRNFARNYTLNQVSNCHEGVPSFVSRIISKLRRLKSGSTVYVLGLSFVSLVPRKL